MQEMRREDKRSVVLANFNIIMLELNQNNFQTEVLQSTIPVLVDFWAPWCGPCKMQGPILEELTNDLAEQKIKIAKLNIDENMTIVESFSISSVPTLIIFQGGEIKEQVYGLQSKNTLREMAEKYLPKKDGE